MSVPEIRGYFERPVQSFCVDPRSLDWILADAANPLNRLARIIPNGARVLDIGVGNGVLGRLLNRVHGGVVIDGVEPDAAGAQHATPYYRKLFSASIEAFLSEHNKTLEYDYIVMADVIEHLVYPDRVLRQLAERLKSSAKICVSTPNIAFLPVRIALLNGVFDYVDSGILERTHLRFFTLHTLLRLFEGIKLAPEMIAFLQRDPLSTEISLQEFSVGPFALLKLLRDELARVYQFLFVLSGEKKDAAVERVGDPGRAVLWRYLKSRAQSRVSLGIHKISQIRRR